LLVCEVVHFQALVDCWALRKLFFVRRAKLHRWFL
jgi:hypothetical protein